MFLPLAVPWLEPEHRPELLYRLVKEAVIGQCVAERKMP